MLIIYEAIDGNYVQRQQGEEHYRATWEDNPPTISQIVSMGADHPWNVLEVQSYQSPKGDLTYIALVHPQDIPTSARESWYGVRSRSNYPNISFNIQFSSDRSFLQLGMNMDGKAPIGHLFNAEPSPDSTQVKTHPSPWKIDQTVIYWPLDNMTANYAAIHLGWCCESVEQLMPV